MSDEKHPNDDYIDPVGATAGPPVPPEVDLEELERQQSREQSTPDGEGGANAGQGTGEVSGDGPRSEENAPADYSDTKAYSADDLEKLAVERELEITGSGANGKPVRADYEKALADDDAAKAASQS